MNKQKKADMDALLTEVETIVEKLAIKEFGFTTLKPRGNNSLDSSTIHVTQLSEMLIRAYQRGMLNALDKTSKSLKQSVEKLDTIRGVNITQNDMTLQYIDDQCVIIVCKFSGSGLCWPDTVKFNDTVYLYNGQEPLDEKEASHYAGKARYIR